MKDRAGVRSEAIAGASRPLVFAGGGDYEFFIERVPASQFVDNLDRWKAMRREGWDVTVLGCDHGGHCDHVIALGCLYDEQMQLRVVA